MLKKKLSHFFTPDQPEKKNAVPKQFSPQEGNQYQRKEAQGLEINKASSFPKKSDKVKVVCGFAEPNCVIEDKILRQN